MKTTLLFLLALLTATSLTYAQISTSKNMVQYMSPKELRGGVTDSTQAVFIVDGVKSGMFMYDKSDTKSPDDSAMVLVSGKKRFIRETAGYIRPQFWGATGDGVADDSPAIQKALNYVTKKGVRILFSSGTYIINQTLKFKPVTGSPTYNFNITLEGDGAGKTIFVGGKDLVTDLLFLDTGKNVKGKDNFVIIKQIQFSANRASRCFYGNHVVGLKIEDCMFLGGEICNVQIGSETFAESYSVYLTRCYFHGGSANGGQNLANLRLYNTRMIVVDGMESDGGKYGIDMLNSDKAIITNCKIEGSKTAAISIKGVGGGEHRITNNLLNPYVGYEPNALFEGKVYGIEIVSINGSNAYNSISNNTILVQAESQLPKSAVVSDVNGNMQSSAGTFWIRGQSSGAVGQVNGFSSKTSKIVLSTRSGKFIEGEPLIQDQSGAKGRLGKFNTNITYGIFLGGSGGYNTLNGNVIRLIPTYGIYSDSDSNILSGNLIEATTGVYANNNMIVNANHFYCPKGIGIKVARRGVGVQMSSNTLGLGKMVDLPSDGSASKPSAPKASSSGDAATSGISASTPKLTSKQRDAIPSPEEGKIIYNLTSHQVEYFNGATWKGL